MAGCDHLIETDAFRRFQAHRLSPPNAVAIGMKQPIPRLATHESKAEISVTTETTAKSNALKLCTPRLEPCMLLQPRTEDSVCSTSANMKSLKHSLAAVLSDVQFWIPFAVLLLGVLLLRWVSQ